MNRRMIWLSIFALGFTMLAADVVVAQEKGRERGKRGQRGRGGPGGFRGFGGGGFTPISLLGKSAVQKELGLNESQTAEAEKLSDAYREESRSGQPRFDFRAFRELSEEEQRKKGEELRQQREEQQKKLNAKYDPKIASLLDPGQADRLDQIILQMKGVEALLEEATAKSLGISKEQQDKIASINRRHDEQRGELFRGGGGQEGFQERFAKMRELGEKRDADVLAVLSADQKQKYAEMKGKEVDRRAVFGGFGRGRGRDGERGRDGGSRGGDRGKRGKRPPM